jgi:hypothetical protein
MVFPFARTTCIIVVDVVWTWKTKHTFFYVLCGWKLIFRTSYILWTQALLCAPWFKIYIRRKWIKRFCAEDNMWGVCKMVHNIQSIVVNGAFTPFWQLWCWRIYMDRQQKCILTRVQYRLKKVNTYRQYSNAHEHWVSVMNNTYIHLRVKDSHIYMYRRGRIYKEIMRNIIIERLIHI